MKYVEVAVNKPLDTFFTYRVPESMRGESLFGKRVQIPFGRVKTVGFVVGERNSAELSDEKIKEILKVVDEESLFNLDMLNLAKWMRRMYLSTVGENLAIMIPSGKRESELSPFYSPTSFHSIENLTEEQEKALKLLREHPKEVCYIYGVTGSGKSEVYLRRAEDVIGEGRQVLYLVPEIALSNQLSDEVYTRFHSRVAIIHSSLTPSQRLKAYHDIKSGNVDLVIGARSSVFAPFRDLGLIIMDEEHETSYKSSNNPRYHARQVAQYRAERSGAQFIMGSATPSLEAWKLISTHKIRSAFMTRRIGEGRFPKVQVVNISSLNRNISFELEARIRETLSQKKGVILFLNRRGYGYSYVCKTCGHVLVCPKCSVTLTYHKNSSRLVCHTCGYSERKSISCPICSSRDLIAKGFGTENVEEEARMLFKGARIERLDSDVAVKKDASHDILERFSKGDIDILLGTQMIAKGLNFPLLGLVGILNADSSLMIPDFRASERTFDLIHQVSGRVGRFRGDGLVVVQTLNPTEPSIRYSISNEPERFYEYELKERSKVLFPPFSRLINITLRGKSREKVSQSSRDIEALASSLDEEYESLEVFRSSPSLIEKMNDNWRYHVLLRSTDLSELLNAAHEIKRTYHLPSGVYMEIDVDPISLL